MDYGEALSRAWEITWHWKVLWTLAYRALTGLAAPPAQEPAEEPIAE